MAEMQPADIRIGDAERDSALTALGEHMSAGRLDIEEYGDRSAKVSTAKTRGELLALFTDLPAPHPTFGPGLSAPAPAPGAVPVPEPDGTPAPVARQIPVGQRLVATITPLAAIAAVALFFALHTWVVFLLIPAIGIVGGAIWGDSHKQQQRLRREEFRAEQRAIRRRGRGW